MNGLIENILAAFVPIVLDFLARLLGLGNVSESIQKILLKIRKPIDDLIEKIIRWVKNKMKSFGKKGKKGKKNTKEDDKKEMKKDKGKEGVTDVDRKRHREIAKEIMERMDKPLPQKTKSFEEFYKIKKQHAKHLEKTYQRKLKKGVRLSIKFESLDSAKKKNKVRLYLEIRTNNLKDEEDLDPGLPESSVKFQMKNGKAFKVIAKPLTRKAGNTTGQDSTGGSGPSPKGWELAKEINKAHSNSWERTHILAAFAHGPFILENIIPARKPVNDAMRTVEKLIKQAFRDSQELEFVAQVSYHGSTKNALYLILDDLGTELPETLDSFFPSGVVIQLKNVTSGNDLFTGALDAPGGAFDPPKPNDMDRQAIYDRYDAKIASAIKEHNIKNRTELAKYVRVDRLKNLFSEKDIKALVSKQFGDKPINTSVVILTLIQDNGGQIEQQMLYSRAEKTYNKSKKSIQNIISSGNLSDRIEIMKDGKDVYYKLK